MRCVATLSAENMPSHTKHRDVPRAGEYILLKNAKAFSVEPTWKTTKKEGLVAMLKEEECRIVRRAYFDYYSPGLSVRLACTFLCIALAL